MDREAKEPGRAPDAAGEERARGRPASRILDSTLGSDALPERARCPFCGGLETEQFSAFGSAVSTSQYYCRPCRSVFEFMKRGAHEPEEPSGPGFSASEAYRDREIRFLGVREVGGWRLKLYAIRYGSRPLLGPVYERGLVLAVAELPAPAVTAERPGVGFVIFHQGRGVHYLVLNWWDRENELFNRVLTRPFGEAAAWSRARGGETACVWDLEVLAFERDAYVERVLSRPEAPDLAGYLARGLEVEAG